MREIQTGDLIVRDWNAKNLKEQKSEENQMD